MIYLIASESNQLIKEYLQEIIQNCSNVLYLDFHNCDIDSVLAEASYYSMFNENKVLVVKNADCFCSEKISENDSNKLLNYFSNPNEFTTLVFIINGKPDMRRKITKYIKDNQKFIAIPTLKPRELLNKVKEKFDKCGYEITDESIYYIINNNANNYDLVNNEIDKIMLYYNKPCKVLYNDVINIVARSLDTNNFKFVDAVISKDIRKSFKILDDLRLMKVEPLSLVGLLAREYRLMLFSKILKKEHFSNFDICNELGLQDWQLDKILRNSEKYKIENLKQVIVSLAKLDLNIKSGMIDKWLGLSKFIIDSAE